MLEEQKSDESALTQKEFAEAAPEIVVSGTRCQGYFIVAKTNVGCFYLGSEPGGLQIIPSKENMTQSFDPIVEVLRNTNIAMRKQWDALNLIVCHCPVDEKEIKPYLSPIVGNQSVILSTPFMSGYGTPISDEVLKLKAFSIHDDVVASASLEKEVANS